MRMSGVGFISALVFLAGCGENHQVKAVAKVIEDIKQQPVKAVETMPKIKTVSKKTYQAQHLRSPFARPHQKKRNQRAPDMQRAKEPLESFPLIELKMVGTITHGGQLWALVQAPDGRVHPVHRGNYVGEHFGRILRITENRIYLLENVKISGQWQKRETHMNLMKSNENAK